MKLYEYEAKNIFGKYRIPVQKGVLVENLDDFDLKDLNFPLVLKAQVLVGGRGKAGGIKIAKTPEDVRRIVEEIFIHV